MRRRRLYGDADFDRIIAAAGGLPAGEIEPGGHTVVRQTRREALRERLDQAAKDFWIANRHGAVPSQYALAADCRLMESALRHALKKLLPADRDERAGCTPP